MGRRGERPRENKWSRFFRNGNAWKGVVQLIKAKKRDVSCCPECKEKDRFVDWVDKDVYIGNVL